MRAEPVRELGGGSPLPKPGGGEGLEERKGVVVRRGLKEAWIKGASGYSPRTRRKHHSRFITAYFIAVPILLAVVIRALRDPGCGME